MHWLCGSSFDAERNSVRLCRRVQGLQPAECKVCRHISYHLVPGKITLTGQLKKNIYINIQSCRFDTLLVA